MSDIQYEFLETVLKIENVSKTLGGYLVLKNVNVDLKRLHRPNMTQGHVIGLIGPSGVGKTTLFRILAGMDKPDCGQVLVNKEGTVVERGMVGVVAQDYPLFAHRTVMGNMTVAGAQGGYKPDQCRSRAHELLEKFGLAEHAPKYPAQLSGGQRQRVAIAQQFMCSDNFLLMDEPFSGLDILAEADVIKFIAAIAQTDELKTIILVTHDIPAALEVCDTLWVMGRDRDESGAVIPGARVQSEINLIDRGLAYRPGIVHLPEFQQCRAEIRELFPRL